MNDFVIPRPPFCIDCLIVAPCNAKMLNLFVAVIMDNFDYLTRDPSILGPHHLDEYIRVWAEYDPAATGRIHYTDMFNMVRNMEPPVGFGQKCPNRLAYRGVPSLNVELKIFHKKSLWSKQDCQSLPCRQKLIRMNMPVASDGTVQFSTTLLALIRESLEIKVACADDMDRNDNELRESIKKLWPIQGAKKAFLLVPPKEELGPYKLTVGKIFAAKLIVETWRAGQARKTELNGRQQALGLFSSLIEAVRPCSVIMSPRSTNVSQKNPISSPCNKSVPLCSSENISTLAHQSSQTSTDSPPDTVVSRPVELGQCDEKSSRIHPLVSSVSQSVNIAVDYIPTSSQNPRQITAINDDVCKPSSQYVDSQLHRDRNVNNRHNRQVIQQSRADKSTPGDGWSGRRIVSSPNLSRPPSASTTWQRTCRELTQMSLQGVQSMIMSPQLARSKVTHNGRCCDLTDLTERSHSFSSTLSSKSMRLWYRQRNDLCHSRSENRVYIPHVFISPSITVSSYSSFDFPRLVESPSNSITNPHVYSFNGHSKFRPHVASPDSQSDSDILEENQLWC